MQFARIRNTAMLVALLAAMTGCVPSCQPDNPPCTKQNAFSVCIYQDANFANGFTRQFNSSVADWSTQYYPIVGYEDPNHEFTVNDTATSIQNLGDYYAIFFYDSGYGGPIALCLAPGQSENNLNKWGWGPFGWFGSPMTRSRRTPSRRAPTSLITTSRTAWSTWTATAPNTSSS